MPGKDVNLAVQISPIRLAPLPEVVERGGRRYPPIAGGATPKWFANGLKYIANGAVNMTTDTLKLMLVTTSYTPTQGTDTFASAFSTNEATGGTGYPAAGFVLGTLTATVSSLTMNWSAASISQGIVGGPFAFRYGCFYKYRGATMSANEVIGYVDFSAQSITDATLNITLTNPLTITAS